jgi:hypothetical protein
MLRRMSVARGPQRPSSKLCTWYSVTIDCVTLGTSLRILSIHLSCLGLFAKRRLRRAMAKWTRASALTSCCSWKSSWAWFSSAWKSTASISRLVSSYSSASSFVSIPDSPPSVSSRCSDNCRARVARGRVAFAAAAPAVVAAAALPKASDAVDFFRWLICFSCVVCCW